MKIKKILNTIFYTVCYPLSVGLLVIIAITILRFIWPECVYFKDYSMGLYSAYAVWVSYNHGQKILKRK